jgi:hypothetical protein
VIVEIPHFGSMRGKERELIMLRSENGETWKEHQYDCKTDDLNELLNGMDEGMDYIIGLSLRWMTDDSIDFYLPPQSWTVQCNNHSVVSTSTELDSSV